MYRKDFTQLTSTERTALANAFNQLWTNGTIQNYASLHNINFNGGQIHWCPSFLPWHRDFLRKLELDLQAVDSSVTLPYWDWTRADSRDLDVGVWKSFFGGRNNTGGEFDHWSYTRSSGTGGNVLPSLGDIVDELKETNYFEYRKMETGSHPPGHTWIGGTMATGNSPLDPLFFLHHCNLDRLWAVWQQNNPGAAQYDDALNTSSDINPNPNVVGLNDSMQVGTTATPNSVLDHTSLGYLYERDILLEIAWYEAEGTVIQTGDARSANLFIRDSNSDIGAYPSPIPHWESPDIWVRNNDPITPGEDPNDGHQHPIVNQVNYLYAIVRNNGSAPANSVSVEAFNCAPGTGMIWPTDFNSMGILNVPGSIPVAGDVRVGPFLWTPTVLNHECLMVVADSIDDPNDIRMFHSPEPHWKPIRFDNNVGQRNVSPVTAFAGGLITESIRVRGSIIETINDFELDATSFPPDTEITLRVPISITDGISLENFVEISQNSIYITFLMNGGTTGKLRNFTLAANADKNFKLKIDFSVNAEHEKLYPMVATQIQNGEIAGRITFDIMSIKDSEDYVFGNPRSLELHTIHCPFWEVISDKNKIPFKEIQDGIDRGYNGCAFCLSEHDTG
ncbi:MAG: hypothetical protein Aureis2KO_24200 [Aureisphaera sp.]